MLRRPSAALVLLALLVGGWPSSAQETAAPAAFAGGAKSITELHGNWQVFCGIDANGRNCVITQNLADEQQGQRMLSIELEAAPEGGMEGALLLPFGLVLTKGIQAQVDAVMLGEARPFTVCYDYGCQVDLEFTSGDVDLLRRGTNLNFVGAIADSGENVTLSVSLAGIASALARSRSLIDQ